jgi:peroxiredoxin
MIKLICSIFLVVGIYTTQAQLRPGANAPEIALPDTNDSIIKLSSFAGKVVLIDFWASWCGPCRASIPQVKRLYKKFKDKGFEVFAVSIDDKKEEWLKAIKHDKLLYTLVVDYHGWYSKVLEQYFVDGIPMSFLLDKTGTIVAINLDGRKLEQKIEGLLK